MVIDTSALVEIIEDGPARDRLADAAAKAPQLVMSAATAVEFFIVMTAGKAYSPSFVGEVLTSMNIKVVPFDAEQMAEAWRGHTRYGGGRHGLNMGDCFSYALAKISGEPLLYVGIDFGLTDVEPAIAQPAPGL